MPLQSTGHRFLTMPEPEPTAADQEPTTESKPNSIETTQQNSEIRDTKSK